MKSQGQLLYQQFKASKICKESAITKGWTDCVFKAGSTEILLAGAIGMEPAALMAGILGSGFWILSVDPEVTVRVLMRDKWGMLVRVDAKSNLQDTGCLYNEAFITLDARVLSPGEINMLASPIPEVTKTPSEQAKMRIKNAQEVLIALGYKPGSPDGVLGPTTRAAINVYRRDKGIRADITDEQLFELLSLETVIQSMEGAIRAVEQLKP
ncbi:MAG: peptidoglycan-binding domain-containing protein [Candidatus Entotheonellia bacterium]